MEENTIAIFGDSSADPVEWLNHSWVELLSREYKFSNFAKRGSSLLYTYSCICRYADHYDKIIIFIPPIGRLWVPNCKIHQHFVNNFTVDLYYDDADYQDKKILDSIRSYFIHLSTYEMEELKHYAMVESIKNKFPTALIIPVTENSIRDYDRTCMNDISEIDYEYYDVHRYTPDFGRTCHMNKENNRIFCTIIKKWIDEGIFDMSVKYFKYPTESKEELFPDDKKYRFKF